MAVAAADAVGLVGAVDGIARPAEIERVVAHRIVRPGPDRLRQIGILLVLGFGRDPDRVGALGGDRVRPSGVSLPSPPMPIGKLRGSRLRREVIEPQLG